MSDRAAHVLYAIDVASRTQSIVAGKTSVRGDSDGSFDVATFDTPTGLAFDGAHTLYIGDVGNRHIRRLDIQSRQVSTLPGVFSQVWGLCFDGEGLDAADELTEAIFHVDVGSGDASLVVGSNRFGYAGFVDGPLRKARLHGPRGVACTADAVLVAERSNALVRRWDRRSQVLKTIAGTANMLGWRDGGALHALFGDLQSVLPWDDRTLYLGDEGGYPQARPRFAEGLDARRSAQSRHDRPRAPGEYAARPEGVTYVPSEGAAFIAGCGTSTVARVMLGTGVTRTFAAIRTHGFIDGYGSEARFSCVSAITTDSHGNLFVGDRYNHAVRGVRVDTAEVSTVTGTPSKCGSDDGSLDDATFWRPRGDHDGRRLRVRRRRVDQHDSSNRSREARGHHNRGQSVRAWRARWRRCRGPLRIARVAGLPSWRSVCRRSR